jgi:hypothetical protein
MPEILTKHLEFIQAAISRMASNSFLLKGWTVTLTAGLFALAAKDAKPAFAVIALLPALAFWGLDAYYLRCERLFRALYDELRIGSSSAATIVEPFSLSTKAFEARVPSWFRTLWSRSIIALHGAVVCVVLSAITLLFVLNK